MKQLCVILLFVVATSTPVVAQVGTGSDIILGRVLRPDSTPLAGASVTITSLVTDARRQTVTGSEGRFTVVMRDGGGRYRVTAAFVGLRTTSADVERYAGEDRLVVTLVMADAAQRLDPVDVRASRAGAEFERAFDAASRGRIFEAEVLERLPVRPGDLFGAALLVPGVIATEASDTSRAAFSVAAQPATQNNVTLDGTTFLFGDVPPDAIRATRIVLNSFDVSRGQFTGGQLAAATKAGTDQFRAKANVSSRPAALQAGPGGFARTYTQNLISGGASGPVGRDPRAYYAVAGEFERTDSRMLSLRNAPSRTLRRLGIHQDSLQRFTDAVLDVGIPLTQAAAGPRVLLRASALGRVDFDLSTNNQIMLRADVRSSREESIRVGPYSISNSGGESSDNGGGTMAVLTSVMGRFINELRAYSSWEHHDAAPYLRAPGGLVANASALDQGFAVTSLHFGGNQTLPRITRATLQEATSELSFLTADGAHRWKLGLMVNRERSEITGVDDRYGIFLYNSISDLESNSPAVFARTLAGEGQLIGTDNGALYLANAWRKSEALHLTYGFRIETSRLADAPPANPLALVSFRRQTRNFLTETRMYPRLGLTYLFGLQHGEPSATLSIGSGEFRGRIPSHLLYHVYSNSGSGNTSRQVMCVGAALPPANWPAFLSDTANIPVECLPTGRMPFGSSERNIAFWEPAAGAPRVWRTAVNFEKNLGSRFMLGVSALYAHGTHNPSASDENLLRAPMFVVEGESRPFFAVPETVVPSTGAVALAASRHFPFYATALRLASGASSRTGQVSLEFSGRDQQIARATMNHFSLAYTFMRARDESNGYPFSNNLPSTARDPRLREWGTTDLERRHSFQGSAILGISRTLELGLVARAHSGFRYTPMVNGDVNGDGFRNDRAFVFSSASAVDTGLVSAMQRVIATADRRARDCLLKQVDRIAGRNSCATPWNGELDLQLNWHGALGPSSRRVTVSLSALNVLSGLDHLLHGGNIRGWGQPSDPDRVLLHVIGFDPASRHFQYTVNERFGTPSGSAIPFRVPFQVGLNVRLDLGAQR